ncbi:MAG: folate-binding protein YgfZ [Burkholderiaceae bacterium]|nr:folate-binding protein YgfZ [Burkholderiaceae bacterium]
MTSALSSLIRPRLLAMLGRFSGFVVRGPDAKAFLQGQLTNDIAHANGTHHQRTGYCTPKGRLLTTMLQWRVADDAYGHLLPSESAERITKRLKMYLLRSKAGFSPADESLAALGIWGEAGERLAATPAANRDGLAFDLDGAWLLVDAPCPVLGERAWIVGSPSQIESIMHGLNNVPRINESAWLFSEVQAAKPWVWESTQERFVPQMVNFELVNGVSFSKGCYPGQEVVARSQYLGKLKRRSYRADIALTDTSDAVISALPGQDIWSGAGATEPCGQVVNAAAWVSDQGDPLPKVALLIETTIEAWETGNLRLGSVDGPTLNPAALPYSVAQAA